MLILASALFLYNPEGVRHTKGTSTGGSENFNGDLQNAAHFIYLHFNDSSILQAK
jgi:hypothetical protein